MPFFRKREHNLRQKHDFFNMNGQLTRFCAKEITFHTNQIPDIEQLVKFVGLLIDGVFSDIDLKLLTTLTKMKEACFAHAANGQNTSSDANRNPGGEIIACLLAI